MALYRVWKPNKFVETSKWLFIYTVWKPHKFVKTSKWLFIQYESHTNLSKHPNDSLYSMKTTVHFFSWLQKIVRKPFKGAAAAMASRQNKRNYSFCEHFLKISTAGAEMLLIVIHRFLTSIWMHWLYQCNGRGRKVVLDSTRMKVHEKLP